MRARLDTARWALGAVLLLAAILFICGIAVGTSESRAFFLQRAARFSEHPRTPPYPTSGLVMYSTLILAEAAVLFKVLTSVRSPLWARALSCGAVAAIA